MRWGRCRLSLGYVAMWRGGSVIAAVADRLEVRSGEIEHSHPLTAGVRAYLTTPFDTPDVLAVVSEHLPAEVTA
jgi:hypothetical protein